jgi:hypothetical protein
MIMANIIQEYRKLGQIIKNEKEKFKPTEWQLCRYGYIFMGLSIPTVLISVIIGLAGDVAELLTGSGEYIIYLVASLAGLGSGICIFTLGCLLMFMPIVIRDLRKIEEKVKAMEVADDGR